jgi:serine/threonine-protein kinase HipA
VSATESNPERRTKGGAVSQNPNRVLVYADTAGVPVLVGSLIFDAAMRRRAGVSTTFTYDPTWLARPDACAIDPSLSLFGRSSTVPGLPGCFQDCSPDRWGRNLVEKRLRALALREGTGQRTLTDVEYLLGVADLTRQGALRLRHASPSEPNAPIGPFIDPDTVVPKLLELPRLLAAADAIERDPDDQTAVKDLLDAGSGSLGGARPKASVRDGELLMMAKFPHGDDTWDVMAWEATALDLAEEAGIAVPGRRLTRINGRAVLILDRFDRTPVGHRLPYVSAMTLLGRSDGDVSDYTDICDAISDEGAATTSDLEALWRRVAFSVAIHNTDDHLRNHGFTRAPGGWTLAPAFDINPNPDTGASRVTGIDGARATNDEALGLESLAAECRLSDTRRSQIVREILDAITRWESVARGHGIHQSEITRFESTFTIGAGMLGSLAQ